jgi:CBS domain-containing protein
MTKIASDVMTPDPVCCTLRTSLDEVARLMVQHDCGQIPVLDESDRPIGVITDRDIVCRVVAKGQNPSAQTAELCMSHPVFTVRAEASLDDVVATVQRHQIRRVPVVDEGGACAGIISQADIARAIREGDVAHLLREVSREGSAEPRLARDPA